MKHPTKDDVAPSITSEEMLSAYKELHAHNPYLPFLEMNATAEVYNSKETFTFHTDDLIRIGYLIALKRYGKEWKNGMP
jgi:hypothetical protein